ncbi:hypothetical protein GSI_07603 [Ganoderma sinense ZZ0214-1]|uniref:Fungal-type protein kinase domain-containing protein n=1 Tax=Ganoderma sinense ZZ0214-1 TaxID=1077348 RepID=A0A2G8S9I0_9APHY|nr:hypothetical protein GSI_07603 [Ganoderma sinense ZZ0214-1]
MRPRFYLLKNELFSAHITGEAPTESERKNFKSPKLKLGMPERNMWPQVGVVIQSVLKAANCKNLCFSHVADRKASEGDTGSTYLFNGGGIYRDPPPANGATNQNSKFHAKIKGRGNDPSLTTRSCFWLEVPVEVKSDEGEALFSFKTKSTDVSSPCGERLEATQSQQTEVFDAGERDDEDGGEFEDTEDTEDSSEDGIEDSEGDEDSEGEAFDSDDGDLWPSAESTHSTHDLALRFLKKRYPPFVNISNDGMKALDQFVEHQLNVFKCQHRTFCYTVYICFDMARLLYVDRAGAFVSEPFSWVEPTSLLHEFIWKLAKLASNDRHGDMGHDTTAKVISLGERRRFVREAKNPALAAHIRAGLKKAAAEDCPLYELTVEDVPPSPDEWFPDEPFPEHPGPSRSPTNSETRSASSAGDPTASSPTSSTHRFIVGRPHFSSGALAGRCTKGFMAFDVTDPKKWVPCFLKDSWRPYVPGHTRPEHLVYVRLRRMNVVKEDGIATLICGGDVGGRHAQCTRVQDDLPPENRPVPRVHYRLVLEDIGLPLSEFRNFGELSGIFADALKAHNTVWKDAKILHHDVSVGNIMIRVDGEKRTGFLIDWDLSRLESELGKGPVEPDRTGTWQFRSALSLLYPRKPYRRSDDVESFIHAFVYLILRYHVTNTSSVRRVVENYFEQASLIGGIKVGGDQKFQLLQSGRAPFLVKSNPPLQNLLQLLFDRCYTAYSNISETQMGYFYGPIENAEPEEDELMLGRPDSADVIKEVSESFDERGDRLLEQRYRMRLTARQSAPKDADLYTPGKFLTSPGTLINLFANHARQHSAADDKAPDQFIARRYQNPYDGPAPQANRGIAIVTLSTSSSAAPEDDIGSAPASVTMPAAGPSRRALSQSSLSHCKPPAKRERPARALEEPPPDEVGEPSSPERLKKRRKVPVKSRKGEEVRGNAN